MAGLLDAVNQRTQMVGQNRLELLLFRLKGSQVYGINVFKVKEVLQCPSLTQVPHHHPVVRGVAHIRGATLPIIDLSQAIGRSPLEPLSDCFVIITEYNNNTQGFLVRGVDRIVNLNWETIKPPPKGAGNDSYLTAVSEVDGKLVEIIDVEKVLAELSMVASADQPMNISDEVAQAAQSQCILIVDDSMIARKQVQRVVQGIGIETVVKENGKQMLDFLKSEAEAGVDVANRYLMLISDIEMPEMDGYTLTANIRNDPRMANLHILLHTSLSGVFNQAMVQKVGADNFLSKFKPELLASVVTERLEARSGAKS